MRASIDMLQPLSNFGKCNHAEFISTAVRRADSKAPCIQPRSDEACSPAKCILPSARVMCGPSDSACPGRRKATAPRAQGSLCRTGSIA
jgi:hypothetical protein